MLDTEVTRDHAQAKKGTEDVLVLCFYLKAKLSFLTDSQRKVKSSQ